MYGGGARKMAQLGSVLPCKHKNLSSDSQHAHGKPGRRDSNTSLILVLVGSGTKTIGFLVLTVVKI